MSLKKVKEIQEQIKEISKLLKKEGYKVGLIALGTDKSAAVNVFGTRKDALNIIYRIIQSLKDEDKLILLAMLFGIDLGRKQKNED